MSQHLGQFVAQSRQGWCEYKAGGDTCDYYAHRAFAQRLPHHRHGNNHKDKFAALEKQEAELHRAGR